MICPWPFVQRAKATFAQHEADQGDDFQECARTTKEKYFSQQHQKQSFYFIFKSVILQKVLLVSAVNRCQISVAGQKCPSARHSSLHSGDLSYCIAVAAHRADLCYSVVDLGHSGALTSCNGLVKVRRLMLCRGDCISASPRGAVDLRQLESDLHHSAPPYHPLQLNKAPLQYPHFFPGVMRGI